MACPELGKSEGNQWGGVEKWQPGAQPVSRPPPPALLQLPCAHHQAGAHTRGGGAVHLPRHPARLPQ